MEGAEHGEFLRFREKGCTSHTLLLPQWKLSLHKNKEEKATCSANLVHLGAIVLAVVLAVSQHFYPHWIVSNLLALSFAFNAISLLRLDSFFTGSALLALLFVYDIW